MMIRKGILAVVCILSLNFAKSQSYTEKSFSQMEEFLQNNQDTLYIINFWATWCKPCLEELPAFEAINKNLSDYKIRIILVSLDTEANRKKSLEPFLAEHKLQNEIWVFPDKKPSDWIDKINPVWQGSIPGTLFLNNTKSINNFEEHAFTYDELLLKIDGYK